MTSFIEFRDVRKTYTMGEVEIKALDGVSFSVDQGEFVIIAGASGAGKSTILNLLGGMDTVTSGQVQAVTRGENPQIQVNGMFYDLNKIKTVYGVN